MGNNKLSEFLSMTRSERIGSYTLLIVLAIIIVCAVGYRSCAGDENMVEYADEQLRRMKVAQSMKDSLLNAEMDSVKRKIKKNHKRKKQIKRNGKYSDGDLPEVPQY